MELDSYCRELPKIELHAHLNGSLSDATMLELKRYFADNGISDPTNTYFDEFQIGAGDTRSLSECFQVFSIAHSLTRHPQTLDMATYRTLKEFETDNCCYIELRSTPRDTEFMDKRRYIETIVQAMKRFSKENTLIPRLIISIDRRSSKPVAEEIVDLAIELLKKFPDVIVGAELSGDPTVGKFSDFVPVLEKARNSGLKITLHCGEVYNPEEVIEMLQFRPHRIGHGACIHPKHGGTDGTWAELCVTKTPVEVCLTSNVNTKLSPTYEAHHFAKLHEAGIPVILCTDDKGVFSTSLSQEYRLCAEEFGLQPSDLAKIALQATQYIFDDTAKSVVSEKIRAFVDK